MLHQRLSGPAVDDLAAVVTQNTAAVLFELELPGQRLNADGGPSAGQHDADAAAGCLLQCRLSARRDDFFGVGQGAVKVQRQNFILHGYSPGMQICVYCTLKWGIMQASCLPLWGCARRRVSERNRRRRLLARRLKPALQGRMRGMFAIFTRWRDTMAGSALIRQWSEPLTASPAGEAFCLRLAISNVLTSILTYATLSEAIRE